MELPLHPGLVHLPIGLAFALPLLALAVSFGIIRAWFPRNTWVLIVALAALQVGTALVAREAGEKEAHRIGKAMPKGAIHEHVLAANFFTGWSVALLVLAAGALALRKEKPFRAATMTAAVLFFFPLATGLRTGYLGGKLVFLDGVPTVAQVPIGQSATGPMGPSVALDAGSAAPAPAAAPASDDEDHDADGDHDGD